MLNILNKINEYCKLYFKKLKILIDLFYQETKKRETKALLKASKELKCNNLLVITKDYEGEEKLGGKKVRFIPLWKWLLD